MPTSDEERNRDPGPVVTAFHRLYVEMLPDGPRQSVEERVEPRVSAVALDAALDKIAKDEAVSPLVKLHGVASLVKHRPTLAVDQSDLLVAVVQSTLETPVSVETTVLATRLQEFAEHYRGSEGERRARSAAFGQLVRSLAGGLEAVHGHGPPRCSDHGAASRHEAWVQGRRGRLHRW